MPTLPGWMRQGKVSGQVMPKFTNSHRHLAAPKCIVLRIIADQQGKSQRGHRFQQFSHARSARTQDAEESHHRLATVPGSTCPWVKSQLGPDRKIAPSKAPTIRAIDRRTHQRRLSQSHAPSRPVPGWRSAIARYSILEGSGASPMAAHQRKHDRPAPPQPAFVVRSHTLDQHPA
jgi:hypothetical protein